MKTSRISVAALMIVGLGYMSSCQYEGLNKNTPKPKSTDGTDQKELAPQVQFNDKQFNPHSDVTPSARGANNKTALYLAGSFIYWQSSFSNRTIAGRLQNPSQSAQKFKLVSLDTQYDPGFKLGIGCNFQRDVWDLFLNWTWLDSDVTTKAHTHTPKFATLLGSFGLGNNAQVFLAGKVEGHWDFDFNSLDLELGRNFYISKYISCRPYAGLKSAWIRDSLKVVYKDAVADSGGRGGGSIPVQTPVVGHYRDHRFGVGPRVGLNSRWVLGQCNVAFLANIAGSVLWEEFNPHANVDFIDPTTGNPPSIARITAHQQNLVPVAEVFLGFDWGRSFNENFYLNLSAGYEMQYFWDQIKTVSFAGFEPENALNLHGLTATLRMDF